MSRRAVASPLPTARPLRLPLSVSAPRCPVAAPVRSGPVPLIGAQIRLLRVASGVSSAQLAQVSGVSRSMLSRIERGLVSPSVQTLERLAQGLDVSITQFFADLCVRTDFRHVSAGKGLVMDSAISSPGPRCELLGALSSGNLHVETCLLTFDTVGHADEPLRQQGLKLLYLFSGAMRFVYADRVVHAQAGDTLLFDATALHGVRAIDVAPVSYLLIVLKLRNA